MKKILFQCGIQCMLLMCGFCVHAHGVCPACLTVNNENANFCHNCGRKLKLDGVKAVGWVPLRLSIFGAVGFPLGDMWDIRGLDMGIFYNVSPEVDGFQLCGGFNLSRWKLYGLQIGVGNATWELHGVQLGIVNCVQDAHGFQIGFMNYAQSADALCQIGAINVIKNSAVPFLPIMNMCF